jgi:hypothetical protein
MQFMMQHDRTVSTCIAYVPAAGALAIMSNTYPAIKNLSRQQAGFVLNLPSRGFRILRNFHSSFAFPTMYKKP